MYLKRIEISGFKSFANKTVLNLDKGITAIVGPNGSGKSNIADAIKWVLGEQSVKSLRGRKSEDVIFAGSEKKAQVSTASVFLAFDNKEDDKPPLNPPARNATLRLHSVAGGLFPKEGRPEFEEIVFGRKVFRDGAGQYLLNGSKVRLSDIVENLAVLGIGQGDHSVINQGMTDRILMSSPLQRRIMLEEAAGIKQFRIKRDQAEKKLESTNQNLTRIADLLAELEPRLKFLRKQTARAEKRSEAESLLRRSQEKYYSAKFNVFKQEREKFEASKKEMLEKIKRQEGELFDLENLLKKESEKESFGAERSAEIRRVLQDLWLKRRDFEKEIILLESRVDLLENQIFDKERRIKSAELEKAARLHPIKKEETKTDEKILVGKSDIKNLLAVLDSSSKESLESLKNALSKAVIFLKNLVKFEKEEKSEPKNPDIEWIDKQITSLKKEMAEDSASAEKTKSELPERKNQLKKVEVEISGLEAEIAQINREDQKRRSKFFEIERDVRGRRADLDKLKNEENIIKIEESRTSVHLEDLEKEIKEELRAGFDFNSIKENPPSGEKDIFTLETGPSRLRQFEADIRKLKMQLEQIGAVDDLTIQEHEETKNRFENMSREFEDLENAKKNLKSLINDLDAQMEKKFNESFKKIAEEFEKYFKMIFGGGSAKIFYSRIKEEKQEESGAGEETKSADDFGVEISAIPPGKKTKNLSVLSGGERALTSIALLFAIIASSPPPFCVLDEVDAALDEANSFRISRVFKELAEKTQFIVITHNREIMSQSSALYGVTMQKDGVSQLLSVRLEK